MTPFLVQITIIQGEYSNIRCHDVWLTETERSTPTTPHTMPWCLVNRNWTFDTYDTTHDAVTFG